MEHLARNSRDFVAVVVLSMALCQSTPCTCRAQVDENGPLESRLATSVSVTWRGQNLADAAEKLGELTKIPVWLDRRVDPHASVELAVRDRSAGDVFQALAGQHDYEITALQGVVYLGPKQTARELATLAAIARQSVAKLPPDARRRWMQTIPLTWPRLSEPRQLARDLIAAAGAELLNADAIPHDLWPQRAFPAMPIVDGLELMLASFDQSIEISGDGATVRVVSIERPVRVSGQYSAGIRRLQAVRQALQGEPDVEIQAVPGGFRLLAGWEQHQRVRNLLSGASGESQRPGGRISQRGAPTSGRRVQQRYTLKIVDKPLGTVLDQLAKQLALSVTWSAGMDVDSQRRKRVSCDVQQVDQLELLRCVLASAGLTFRQEGTHVVVVPATNDAPEH